MGQKVNPNGMRVGINRAWNSNWFANKQDFATFLHEDIKIRKYLTAELKKKGANYNLSKTKIYGNDGYVVEQIYSTKYVTTYFFKDVLDKLYTIEITSPNKRSDLFNSIYTYRLENVEN